MAKDLTDITLSVLNYIVPSHTTVVQFETPVILERTCKILSNTTIGAYTYFGRDCMIGTLSRIGRFCSIAPRVCFGLGEHPHSFISTHPVFYGQGQPFGVPAGLIKAQRPRDVLKTPPRVGSDVWIGANAIISRGVSIGHGAVVAAGAVVRSDVPPYAIVGGTPARVLKMRFSDALIERLLAAEWWEYDISLFEGIDVTNPEIAIDAIEERIRTMEKATYEMHTFQRTA